MSKKQQVFSYIDNNRQKIVDYLADLVRKPSINYADEGKGDEKVVQDFIEQSLKDEGYDEVKVLAFDDEKKRPNVVGLRKGTGGGKSLIFNGHCDVVPVAYPERWICDPFDPIEKDGKLYGRGTSDMKGGIAAAYYALKAIKDCGIKLKGDVMLHSVVGEESQSAETLGTAKVIEAGYKADFAICCEPSDLEIHIASPALLFFKLIVEGKGVHTSARNQMLFPQGGGLASGNAVAADAFKKSLPLIDYIFRLETEWNHRFRDPVIGYGGKPVHDKQGVGVFTMNPSEIKGGEYLGTVPSRMEYTFCVWYPDQMVTKEEVLDEIRRGVAAIASTDDWLREHPPIVEGPVIQDWPGFRVDENHSGVLNLKEAVQQATDNQAVISCFKAVCDAYYLNKLGITSIVLGPGSISNSVHGDNEFIYVDDLIAATKIYAAFAMDWCGVEE
jgi:acetylornithine deacetylase/succinyl-diaminopimelate desuccinylase family protein